MLTPISTHGVVFKYGASTPTTIVDIKSFPSILGNRSSLETTTMSDDAQTFIPGIRQQDDSFPFGCNYDKDVMDAINKLDAPQKCSLEFPDGSKFTWDAYLSVSNDSGDVDAVIGMTINATPTTVPVFVKGD